MASRSPIEFAVHMLLDRTMILQEPELDKVDYSSYFIPSSPCHIYFVCRRPRITFVPDRIIVRADQIEVPIRVQTKDKFDDYIYSIINQVNDPNIDVYCPYPYSLLELRRSDKKLVTFKAAPFTQKYGQGYGNIDFIDLEILYIGQSYGTNGLRTAPTRLKSHSTLQQILANSLQNRPDSEVWIMLASFEQLIFTSIFGDSESNEFTDTTKKDKIFKRLLSNGISEDQAINLTEAALIRYFQPEYNLIYRDSFPNHRHKTYSECYAYGLNSISIELNTLDCLGLKIYSNTVPRKNNHMFNYTLHTEVEKRSMFEFFPGFQPPGLQN